MTHKGREGEEQKDGSDSGYVTSNLSTHGKNGTNGIKKFGVPSPRACSGQAAPAAILDAPATKNVTPSTTEAIVATQVTRSDEGCSALACREHLDTQRPAALDRLTDQVVEHVIVMSRIVVEQGESLDSSLPRQPDRKFRSAVTPVALLFELIWRVLRIVNQQINIAAEVEHTVGRRKRSIGRHLVITDIRNRAPIPSHAISNGVADMRNQTGHQTNIADRELVVTNLVEPDRARKHREVNREQRGLDRVSEDLLDTQVPDLPGRIDRDIGPFMQHRLEEWQPLDVIPVQVSEKAGPPERFTLRQGETEVTKTCSEVEEKWVVARYLN